MIEIRFKPCCQECKERDTYLNENMLSAYAEKVEVTTQIGCKHEAVCKEYRGSEVSDAERN